MAFKCTVINQYTKNNRKRKQCEGQNEQILSLQHPKRIETFHNTEDVIKSEITEEEQKVVHHQKDSQITEEEKPQYALKTEIIIDDDEHHHKPKKMVSRSTSMSPPRLKRIESPFRQLAVIQKACKTDILYYQKKLETLNEKNRRNERKIFNLETAIAKLTEKKQQQRRFKVLNMVQIKKEK